MNEQDKLTLLKIDIGILTDKKDVYLKHLLGQARDQIKREGIKEEDTAEYHGLEIQYAAYLFRRRAASETVMPRFLRYGLNNLLISQKGKANDV